MSKSAKPASPAISVVVPARNEAADIVRCLEALAAQDLPYDEFEVLVVDGASTDGTAELASHALERLGMSGRVLFNDAATTPSNLNAGLSAARGRILCRVDGRSLVPPEYLRTCRDLLDARPDVAVVGGRQVAMVDEDAGAIQHGIARALNNKYAMGGSRYRRATNAGSSDTVYLGAFRTEQLRDVNGWDERLRTNQDFDLNRRLRHYGLVWFDPALYVGYVPRRTFHALAQQYHRFGRAKVDYWRLTIDPPRPRQAVLVVLPPVVGSGIVSAVATGGRRVYKSLLALVLLTTAVLVIDELGSREAQEPPPHRRLLAAGALSTIGVSWCTGVLRGMVQLMTRRRYSVDCRRSAR